MNARGTKLIVLYGLVFSLSFKIPLSLSNIAMKDMHMDACDHIEDSGLWTNQFDASIMLFITRSLNFVLKYDLFGICLPICLSIFLPFTHIKPFLYIFYPNGSLFSKWSLCSG